jgi:hypothetical protein
MLAGRQPRAGSLDRRLPAVGRRDRLGIVLDARRRTNQGRQHRRVPPALLVLPPIVGGRAAPPPAARIHPEALVALAHV